MPSESLELQIAESKIQGYDEEFREIDQVLRDHYDAQECANCEKFLTLGIDAFHWLDRGEQAVCVAETMGILEAPFDFLDGLKGMYNRWLAPCAFVEEWIACAARNGYAVEGADEFRRCCDKAKAWLEQNEWHENARDALRERFSQEPW